jgi:c-di-GMP-binding flagellar brake protein YcgR
MSNPDFKISPGDVVQMQLANNDESRYFVKVIGYLPGQSLLVTTPTLKGVPMALREGQFVTVRLLSKNTVYAFESSVVKVTIVPYPYLHLNYPSSIESQVVRNAQRAVANIICSVENPNIRVENQQGLPAIIANLSSTGALLESRRAIGTVGENVVVNVKLTVAKIEKYLSIAAVIRNVREKPHSETRILQHGVEFQLLSAEDQLLLHGFVYEQIALGKAI